MNDGHVLDLKLKGESLHKTIFVKDKSYHKYFVFAEMKAEYKFSYHAAEGSCVLNFGFPKYFNKQSINIEFEIDIQSVTLNREYSHVSKIAVSKFLLKEFEKMKLEQYRLFKFQNLSKQYTPPQ